MFAIFMMFVGFVLFFVAMIVPMSVKVDLGAKPKSVQVARKSGRKGTRLNLGDDFLSEEMNKSTEKPYEPTLAYSLELGLEHEPYRPDDRI